MFDNLASFHVALRWSMPVGQFTEYGRANKKEEPANRFFTACMLLLLRNSGVRAFSCFGIVRGRTSAGDFFYFLVRAG